MVSLGASNKFLYRDSVVVLYLFSLQGCLCRLGGRRSASLLAVEEVADDDVEVVEGAVSHFLLLGDGLFLHEFVALLEGTFYVGCAS